MKIAALFLPLVIGILLVFFGCPILGVVACCSFAMTLIGMALMENDFAKMGIGVIGFILNLIVFYILRQQKVVEVIVTSNNINLIVFLLSMAFAVTAMDHYGLFAYWLDKLIQLRFIKKRAILFVVFFCTATLAAGFIDEVNVVLVLGTVFTTLLHKLNNNANQEMKFTKKEIGKLNLYMLGFLHIGSMLLAVGNPVSLILAEAKNYGLAEFASHTWVIAGIVFVSLLGVFFLRCKIEISKLENLLTNTLSLEGLNQSRHPQVIFVGSGTFLVAFGFIAFHQVLESIFDGATLAFIGVFTLLAVFLLLVPTQKKAWQKAPWTGIVLLLILFELIGFISASGVLDAGAMFLLNVVPQGYWQLVILAIVIYASSGLVTAFLDNAMSMAAFLPLLAILSKQVPHGEILYWVSLVGNILPSFLTPIGSSANIILQGFLNSASGVKLTWKLWWNIVWLPALVMNIVALSALLIPLLWMH